ncbi:hypothetical protein [Paenibacillus xylanexedens]|uniref:KOW domain-containing protein n=1 Tax=Paenibacillus xylanexedens TaxID=528191 RepID=A0ABS4RQY7_PAEXY|nr:hypothetical protein [Paenibacillus xylanexedens]MBP2245296.1 hypothetical protein [Paenibacillus xylanexedens]
MNTISIGEKVFWKSQAGGSAKEKQGIVIGICIKGAKAFKIVPNFNKIPKSRVKFQNINDVYDRLIVSVPRGGKSILDDYYAPSLNIVKKIEGDPV